MRGSRGGATCSVRSSRSRTGGCSRRSYGSTPCTLRTFDAPGGAWSTIRTCGPTPTSSSIGDATPIATELVRRLTDYSAARPGLDIALPGEAVIEATAWSRRFVSRHAARTFSSSGGSSPPPALVGLLEGGVESAPMAFDRFAYQLQRFVDTAELVRRTVRKRTGARSERHCGEQDSCAVVDGSVGDLRHDIGRADRKSGRSREGCRARRDPTF